MTRFQNLKGVDPNGNIVNYISNQRKDKYGYYFFQFNQETSQYIDFKNFGGDLGNCKISWEYEKKYLSIDIYNYKPLFLIDINYDLLLIPSNTLKEIRSSEFETYAVYNPNATLNHLVTPPNIEEHKVIGLSDAFISPDTGITLIKVSCEYDYVYIIEYDPAKKLWGRIIRNYISRW